MTRSMKQVLILVGVSGSGKSTWAKEFCQNETNWLRISRDELRRSLIPVSLGAYWHWPKEDQDRIERLVDRLHTRLLLDALRDGWQVIMDNTHLKKAYFDTYKTLLLRNVPAFEMQYKLFDPPLEVCQERDHLRPDSVGANAIAHQYAFLQELKTTFDFKPFTWPAASPNLVI
ncbi:AAA family ATPase [Siphonobacter sp. BAB-5405]|uniref:AAA family ATPase n=1 Tax=Siphonobacter sp. BAB-5405 TaxID=1864825 RepID=UPI0027145496|nr:AAA family ATPase [Siphonobacter sp. BAB-5405]